MDTYIRKKYFIYLVSDSAIHRAVEYNDGSLYFIDGCHFHRDIAEKDIEKYIHDKENSITLQSPGMAKEG